MSPTAIVADSGCDLPPALAERYRIIQVPLFARFGAYELVDTPETRAEFWQKYDISQPPQSAGPSVGIWAEAYERALQQADEVVVITLTGKHSVTFNSAVIAANDFAGRVHAFDSWSLSVGEGLLTLHAAQLAAAGASAADILTDLTERRARLRIGILLDTVEAVRRGGRLAPVMSAIKRMSSLLSIKPILTIREGVIAFDGAVRSGNKGMRRLVNDVAGKEIDMIAVAHTRAPARAERLADSAAEATGIPRAEFIVAEAGPALAVHAGPGAFGIAYVSKAM